MEETEDGLVDMAEVCHHAVLQAGARIIREDSVAEVPFLKYR